MSRSIATADRSPTARMRHRITVQTATTAVDASRQKIVTYVTRWTGEPAAIEEVSGGETVRGRQVEAGVSVLFRVNYRPGYSVTDRIIYDGQNYGIVRIETPDGVKRFHWLHCKAVM